MNAQALVAEVERNYDYFQRHLAEFMPAEYRRYALLRDSRVVGFFDDAAEAELKGEGFPDGLYSIQLVDPEPVNLGLYSSG
jgi:hypothetical protein